LPPLPALPPRDYRYIPYAPAPIPELPLPALNVCNTYVYFFSVFILNFLFIYSLYLHYLGLKFQLLILQPHYFLL
jgi:hypothetical protein